MSIETGKLSNRLKAGDSLSVDGVCLTITAKKNKAVTVDVSPETLKLTNLGSKQLGHKVNLELPLTATTFVSGHMVQGHVDGTGRVVGWKREQQDVRLRVKLSKDLITYCVHKGSIAVNGVSLTIASLSNGIVEIALIPYTLEHTNLGDLQPGDRVNIETDVIGKYVVSILQKSYDKKSQKG